MHLKYPVGGAGHLFCSLMRDSFPVNVLNRIKDCPEVCTIYCATANLLEVIVASAEQGNGIIEFVYGYSPKGLEGDKDRARRKEFLKNI